MNDYNIYDEEPDEEGGSAWPLILGIASLVATLLWVVAHTGMIRTI